MTEKIKEGDVHKVFTIDSVTFEIRYGYNSPEERKRGWEPTPIYPDFIEKQQYNAEGFPFVTVYQEICEHYKPKEGATGEEWCTDCEWMEKRETYIGICRCGKRKRENNTDNNTIRRIKKWERKSI